MSSAPLKAPNPATSPFVRGSRYIMLAAGIMYGSWRLKSLTKKEEGIQKRENEIRARRDARLSQEAEAKMRVEMNALAEEVGVEDRM